MLAALLPTLTAAIDATRMKEVLDRDGTLNEAIDCLVKTLEQKGFEVVWNQEKLQIILL